ncbi:MocR-like pyridoxine biosynthesis transcription factor PdxR [Pannonibacter tanglangensis]|uniref:MocR-like pyridoxine biosynthesis transcription factor PdxR n=1 Tax=Pannonibacter tanglangensis TaxID=2750084 RepID=UPI001AD92970|nr:MULTISPECIES: PLP-dependent aminotransferase family protein [unclassified Pannonibacter]
MLDGVIEIDRNAAEGLPQQIYGAVRRAVLDGRLPRGARLPSSRALAESLGVSRNSVNHAFELLAAEGIIEVRPGAAPRLAPPVRLDGAGDGATPAAGPSVDTPIRPAGLSARGHRLTADPRGPDWIFRRGALQPGLPDPELFPTELWARGLRRAVRTLRSGLLYDEPAGLPVLREALAGYLAAERGVRASPGQILIVSSMQAALSALAQAFADEGDAALVENPGYTGARLAFLGAGLSVHPLPADERGADISRLPAGTPTPRLIYVTPSQHYPLGGRMTLDRRLALIATARSAGALILEDDYDSEFLFEGRPIAALQGLAEQGEVIYLGTFSKSLLPGLRIAYCVVPDHLVAPLTLLMRNTGRQANAHVQAAVADFLREGHHRAHLRRVREIYAARGHALHAALAAGLGNRVRVTPPTGNIQLALRFNLPLDDRKVVEDLGRHGFAPSPLSPCYCGSEPDHGLILGYASATAAEIDRVTALLDGMMASAGHT